MVRHPETGKYRRTRLFVLTLGYSRKSVRLLVWKSSTREWASCTSRPSADSAARCASSCSTISRKACSSRTSMTRRSTRSTATCSSTTAPWRCRAASRDPDRKGKVESAVGHAQRTPLKGLRFESIEEAQAYLDRWEERWADTRIHGTTKRQVAAMFAEEKPALLPLPLTPFRYYQFGKRTVHLNGCVEVDGAYYGPPPGYIGHELDVQWDGVHVRILDPHDRRSSCASTTRSRRGRARMLPEDKPKRTPPTTLKLLNRAGVAGKSIGLVCKRIHEVEGELGVNRILGVLGLAKRHGVQRCRARLRARARGQRAELPIREALLERLPAPPLSLRQVDPLIRQLSLYRDLIDRRTRRP